MLSSFTTDVFFDVFFNDGMFEVTGQETYDWPAWHHLTDIADFNKSFPDILLQA